MEHHHIKDAGVTATFLSSEYKFALSSEKGSGHEISLEAYAAYAIFDKGDKKSQDNTDGETSILYNGMHSLILTSVIKRTM